MDRNKILIVDDSRSILAAYSNILTPHYQVEQASNGEKALELVPHFIPDLILLDIEMPGISGHEVCRKIRSQKKWDLIKVIMVSSLKKLKERLKGYEKGADDYLGKPFEAEELLAKVRVFLRLKAVEDELAKLNKALHEQVKLRTRQLINAEKMAAVGRHTAGIVHNLNSPLQVIMGNAELLELKYRDNARIQSLTQAAEQMKQIIMTLLNTSRLAHNTQSRNIDLNEVITHQIELLKANPKFEHDIKTELQLEPLPPYRGVYAHFSQSLGNLIDNAVEAMYESDAKWLFIASYVVGDQIVIQVSDTGEGIARGDMSKIFGPFFTTKPLTATDDRPTGTGLGLVSCKEMIESYGGKIDVESEPGMGTTFKVLLPFVETKCVIDK